MVRADCSLTHCEEDTKQAVFAYVMAIRHLLNGKNNKVVYFLKFIKKSPLKHFMKPHMYKKVL